MRQSYPPIEPYRQGRLSVSELHTLYFEEAGNPEGKPVVFLHGGP
ncbi:MAG: prolyl aminopeptidase, partial [Cyanobacteria bacterium P01_F01_bin.116]